MSADGKDTAPAPVPPAPQAAASPDARWLEQSRRTLDEVKLTPRAETLGRVTHIADGMARISGLPDVRLNELVHFEGGETGLVLALDADTISAVLLDEASGVEAGTRQGHSSPARNRPSHYYRQRWTG